MSDDRPGGPHDDDLGSVAEEAAKLLGALSSWAKDQGGEWAHGMSGLADQAAGAARTAHQHLDDNIATGSPECRYCPVCRTVHAVRQLSPEVREHLATAATSLMQAAAGLMATHVPDDRARPGVERIDLDPDDTDESPETDA